MEHVSYSLQYKSVQIWTRVKSQVKSKQVKTCPKNPLKYQFQKLYFLSESSELPRQVSFTNNEELNNSSSSTNPDGATPRKSDAGRTRKKKRKRKSTTKVMSKVMAVRQQQQKLTFSGFETNSSVKDSSSNTNTSTSGTASTSGGACASTTTTRWEMSAETLLTMTRTFLRYVPEVNKLFYLIFFSPF